MISYSNEGGIIEHPEFAPCKDPPEKLIKHKFCKKLWRFWQSEPEYIYYDRPENRYFQAPG